MAEAAEEVEVVVAAVGEEPLELAEMAVGEVEVRTAAVLLALRAAVVEEVEEPQAVPHRVDVGEETAAVEEVDLRVADVVEIDKLINIL